MFLKVQLIFLMQKVSENIKQFMVSIKELSEHINFDWYDPEYMGTIADWVSGIGTLIAVIVTLYFSTRDNRKRLKVSVTWSYLLYANGDASGGGTIAIDAVNLGKIPVHIKSVGLMKRKIPKYFSGIFPKSLLKLQLMNFYDFSDKPPTVVGGQESKSFTTTTTSNQLKDNDYISKKMRAYIQDSTGKFYYSKKIKL